MLGTYGGRYTTYDQMIADITAYYSLYLTKYKLFSDIIIDDLFIFRYLRSSKLLHTLVLFQKAQITSVSDLTTINTIVQ